MANEDFVVKLKADSSEFKNGMSQVSASMSKIRSEFQLAQSRITDFGDKTQTLQNRSRFLTDSLESQRQKVQSLRDAVADAALKTGSHSEKTQQLVTRLNQAEAQENRFARDLTNVNRELQVQSSRFTQVGQKLQSISQKFGSVGEKMSSIGSKMTSTFTMPIVAGFTAAIAGASDLNETIGKVGVVFGDNAKSVEEWGSGAIKNFGLAKGTALDMVSLYGDMATGMGFTKDAAATMGEQLVGRAADLASFKNISTEVAKTALNGIFSGETESLKQLGVVMTQANLQEYAHSQGIQKKIQDMSQAEQVTLRYNYVMQQTSSAQGDFARTSTGQANSTRIFHETIKELQTTLGEKFLPVITPIVQKVTEMVTWFGSLGSGTQNVILGFTGFLAVIGPIVSIGGALSTALEVVTGWFGSMAEAIGATEGVMAIITGPIGIATAAIAGITAVVITLWNTNEGFRTAVTTAWNYIQQSFTVVWTYITDFIQNVLPPIWNAVGPMFQVVWQGIVTFLGAAWDGFSVAFSAVVEAIKVVWNAISPFISAVFSSLVGVLDGLWQTFQGVFTVVVDVIRVAWNALTNVISSVWSGVVNLVSSIWSGFGPIFSGVCSVITSVWSGISNGISSVWNSIVSGVISAWNSIVSPFQSVANTIGSIWQGIKSFFKLPHFTFSGSMNPLDWIKGGLPKIGVEWYSSGGIFTRPTVLGGIGVGDANNGVGSNAEAVLPINKLFESMNNYFDERLGTNNNTSTVPIVINLDGNKMAEVLAPISNVIDGKRLNLAERGILI